MNEATMPVDVVLVEDHAPTRVALAETLGDTPDRVDVLACYESAEAMLDDLERHHAAVALVDMALPGMQGAELIAQLSKRRPELHCVALTVIDREHTVLGAVRAGAYGYLLKDDPPGRVLEAIEHAAEGGYPFSSRVAGFLARQLVNDGDALATRERELAGLLAQGASYAECAEKMGIRIGTVQSYVKSLYRKLGINSRRELRDWARRKRL